MNNTKIKAGIICPLDDEYNSCKEILDLKNESEMAGGQRRKGRLYKFTFTIDFLD